MAGIGLGRHDLVGLQEPAVGAKGGMVDLERLRGGVGIDVGGVAGLRGLARDDRDAALRTDHVLHEEGFLGHHGTPAGLVPTDGTVGEGHLQVAVIDLPRRHVLGEAGADAGDAHRPAAGHETHHVDVMDPAVDDGAAGLQEGLMGLPHVAIALLIQVHAHDQRLAQRLHGPDELRPGRVVAEDIADDDLALRGLGFGDDLLGRGDGDRERLLDEHVATGLERGDGVFGVGVRVAGDRDRVGLGRLERGMEVGVFGVAAAELGVEPRAGFGGAGDQADDPETGQLMVSEGVRTAHVAGADTKDAERGLAHAPSIVLRSPASSREKAGDED